jgi:LysR family transcriptional regulator, hydrogen peroxide-inducible genes activator
MTLQELRYLVALADTGHFGQAAEACFVSQSTLSTGLKKLEDFLGVIVFDRSLKRVSPTPIGREIVESARRIVDETARIRELASFAKDPMDRTLHLGVIPTLGPYYLPHVLTRVREAHPRLRLLLREEMTPHMLAHLAEGKLDAGLLALPIDDPSLDVAPLFEEPFLAAVPAKHALAKLKSIDINELADAGLMLLEEGHCLRDQALAACHLQTLKSEEIRATSLETLRQMVAMELGVTLIPALAGAGSNATGSHVVLKPIAKPGASRVIGLVWRKRSAMSTSIERLAETLSAKLPPGVIPVLPTSGR